MSKTLIILVVLILTCSSIPAQAETLMASWYSIDSLKKEGTYAKSHGIMANGHKFEDGNPTCASNDFPLGSVVRVVSLQTGRSIRVVVTDRMARRFTGKRIDLTPKGFIALSGSERGLEKGLMKVKVEAI